MAPGQGVAPGGLGFGHEEAKQQGCDRKDAGQDPEQQLQRRAAVLGHQERQADGDKGAGDDEGFTEGRDLGPSEGRMTPK